MTILRSQIVDQAIDRPAGRSGRFIKDVVFVRGDVPLCLIRKRRHGSDGSPVAVGAPVLLVHGFGQNRHAWHLPSRSFVNHLATAGFDVFNLDLRGQGRSRMMGAPSPRALAEYVEEDLPRAIEEVRRTTGRRDVFLVGHSLGGLIAYATASLAPDLVSGVVTLGSPYLFTRGSGALKALALFVGMLDKMGVDPGSIPLPLRNVGRGLHLARRYLESPLYPVKLRGWRAGGIEHDVLAEHMEHAFDLASLKVMMTMFGWSGGPAFGSAAAATDGLSYAERFERCRLPLLVIAGTADDLAPPASVEPAFLRSRSPDKMYREVPFGHIDLLVGRDAPTTTWLIVERWLGERALRVHAAQPVAAYGVAGEEDVP